MAGKNLTIGIIGAGGRGLGTFGRYIAEHAPDVKVVAIADPDAKRRQLAKRMFRYIKEEMLFDDWKPFVAKGKICDAVIIATMEDIHIDIAPRCAKLGYDILMEKPMAPTEDQCRQIVREMKEAGIIFSICHELRYTPFFKTIKRIIDSGKIGQITHVQHFEDVAYWHFTH